MARQVFFSFHYSPDCWRAAQVRNSWVTQERKAAGFFDSAEWEEVKRKQKSEIERWIDKQLDGTSVTVVLIGSNTAGRPWIDYEITASHKKGNGLLGIYIHNKENSQGQKGMKGKNPFDNWSITRNGEKIPLSKLYPTYDWVDDNGYKNMGDWIEMAAKKAGR